MKPPRIFIVFVTALCSLTIVIAILAILSIVTCTDSPPPSAPPPERETDFVKLVGDGKVLRWYSDPIFDEWIIPLLLRADTCTNDTSASEPARYCVVVNSPVKDYRCTVLPDTVYGLIIRPYDKLFCVRDTCRSLRQDNVEYEIKTYRANMIDLCDYCYWVIDRIEDGIATLEKLNVVEYTIKELPQGTLPTGARESDVLREESGGTLYIDREATAARAAQISERFNRLK